MSDNIHKNINKKGRLSIFDYAIEIIGWLQIVASPLIVGLVVGGIVYFLIGNSIGLILGILIVLLILFIGIKVANKVWNKKGTINFMSRINASPELDNSE
jgi:hypothetical protein